MDWASDCKSEGEGSTPSLPSRGYSLKGKHQTVDLGDAGSNPTGPAKGKKYEL